MIVSKAQIDKSRQALEAALKVAYAPMDVNGKLLCWDGRIAQAVEKADSLINAGTLTRDKVESIISGFQSEQRKVVAAVNAAHEEYVKLCKQANVPPQLPQRPQCPCDVCAATIRHQAAEELQRAIAAMLDNFGETTVATVGTWVQKCKQLGVRLELDFGYTKVDFQSFS